MRNVYKSLQSFQSSNHCNSSIDGGRRHAKAVNSDFFYLFLLLLAGFVRLAVNSFFLIGTLRTLGGCISIIAPRATATDYYHRFNHQIIAIVVSMVVEDTLKL